MGSCSEGAPDFIRVRRGAPIVALLLLQFSTAPALAQHCEPPTTPEALPFRATARAEAAHFESGDERGFYEGFALGAAAHYAVFRARASLPYYRLLESTGPANGLGDLETKLEGAVFDDATWSLGGAFAASFPTGSAQKRLGMGHVMLGPSVWLSRGSRRLFASAELGFMTALDGSSDDSSTPEGGHAHHHHQAAANAHHEAGGPIPNPMNPHETWLGVGVSYEPLPVLRLSLGGTGAVPTTDDGESRATLRAGVEFPLGVLTTGVGCEVDVLGVTRREVMVATLGGLF
ncbi:MAG TPA: hypothetical protein VMS65_16385 [Polyangiaceae bacterium]|nr:hypothetical protein [Polyangiaceae bacterium]